MAAAALIEGCSKSPDPAASAQTFASSLGSLVTDACARGLTKEPDVPVLQQSAAFAFAQCYTVDSLLSQSLHSFSGKSLEIMLVRSEETTCAIIAQCTSKEVLLRQAVDFCK